MRGYTSRTFDPDQSFPIMHETIQTPKQEAAEVLRNLPDDSILEDIPKQRDLTPLADPFGS